MTKQFSIIVACDRRLGIGKDGKLPWRLKGDMAFFKETTTRGPDPVVIMGRKTWESIPEKFRPLPGRKNVVLTRNKDYALPDGVGRSESLTGALESITSENVFVIGGGEVYEDAVIHPSCKDIYMTVVEDDFVCDVSFPQLGYEFIKMKTIDSGKEGDLAYRIEYMVRR